MSITTINSPEQAIEETRDLKDGLGKRIDEHILMFVASLRYHGFHTRQSCEGHFPRGRSYSWVDIYPRPFKEMQELSRRYPQYKDMPDSLREELKLESRREAARCFELLSNATEQVALGEWYFPIVTCIGWSGFEVHPYCTPYLLACTEVQWHRHISRCHEYWAMLAKWLLDSEPFRHDTEEL